MKHNLAVIGYYSLASGFLTGKYRSEKDLNKSARGGGIGKQYLNQRGLAILAALDDISARHKTTPASLALAWLIHRPSVTAPIASATSVEQLKDIANAAQIALSSEDIKQLDKASAY